MCRKLIGEHPCRSVISIKLLCNFIEITLPHGCSAVNLLHAFLKHLFYKNTSGGLLLNFFKLIYEIEQRTSFESLIVEFIQFLSANIKVLFLKGKLSTRLLSILTIPLKISHFLRSEVLRCLAARGSTHTISFW